MKKRIDFTRVTVGLDDDVIEFLDEQSKSFGFTRTWFINACLKYCKYKEIDMLLIMETLSEIEEEKN